MSQLKNSFIVIALLLTLSLTSCQAIGEIFKAGVWVGVIAVVIVIVIIFWLIGKAGKK
jgi:amino acid transporter